MTDLLDLMVPPTPPIWRDGVALPIKPYVPAQDGDLQWMAHDYRDHRKGGRWFRYDGRECIWRCLDPYDQMGINRNTATPPALDRHGRFV